jgi:hypothetical protein
MSSSSTSPFATGPQLNSTPKCTKGFLAMIHFLCSSHVSSTPILEHLHLQDLL